MNRFFKRAAAVTAVAAAGFIGSQALAIGWPANYEGVMLQGFYWDSYKAGGGYGTTKWTDLTNQADELSQYFDLIWVPNSAQANGENYGGNGYMPVYWFTNHRCAYGTEAELKNMIKTFKEKGTGFIEDVVVNHRCGATNWYNFPAEQWNGQTWQLSTGSITSGDEVWSANQGCPASYKGNADTGEDFNGARDLDHTNANVQNNVKNYCKFLLDELGYVGFRLDMVKGYGGQYTKIYNQYAKPKFSVGEYWDGNYDAVAAWIEATGKESAAFDFPCKYQINKAMGGGENLTELVWKAMGTTNQPAGLIHYGYGQLAVTFVDNHDTFRDGSKYTGNVMMANAFILMSPGTPCIFWPHYYSNKTAMQQLIKARKSVGIHNCSPVTVLQSANNLYVAEVTGTKGKAIVKIGSGNYNAPSGYTLATSGTNYAVWTTNQGGNSNPGGNTGTVTTPSKLYIMGNIQGANWSTSASPAMTKSGDKFTATVTLTPDANETKCYFSFTDALGSSWDELNATANRYGASSNNKPISNNSSDSMTAYLNGVDASGCQSWEIAPGTYTITADFSNMTVTVGENQGGGNGGGTGDDKPSNWTIYFDNSASNWSNVNVYAYSPEALGTWSGTPMTKDATSGYYKLTTTADLSGLNLIFNNGSGSQTGDDVKAVNNGIYKYNGEKVGTGVYVGTYEGGGGNGGGNDNPDKPVPGGLDLYIVGAATDWSINPDYKFTYTGNDIYTLILSSLNGEFKIKDADPDWKGVNLGGDTGGEDVPTVEAVIGNNTLWQNSSVNLVADNWKSMKFTLTYTSGAQSATLNITPVSGIDEVEINQTPVYFNLQGMKVHEPLAPGIYIRVMGNKTDKVLVK